MFIFLGDNIYADTDDMAVMSAKYRELDAIADFNAFRRVVPLLATWDDHDYGRNDAGIEYEKKAEAQTLFLDFFRVPLTSPRRTRAGVYDAVTVGSPGKRVQLLLLDTRYHRTTLQRSVLTLPGTGPYVTQTDPAASLLGAAQWAWLEAELARPADLRVLLSSIQLLPDEHGYEKWMNLPSERARLFRVLAAHHVTNLVVLSGDRHFGELSRLDPGPAGSPLYDVTSSSLTAPTATNPGANRLRVGEAMTVPNFGTLEIDWSAAAPTVTASLHDESGGVGTTAVVLSPPIPRTP